MVTLDQGMKTNYRTKLNLKNESHIYFIMKTTTNNDNRRNYHSNQHTSYPVMKNYPKSGSTIQSGSVQKNPSDFLKGFFYL